VLSRWKIDAAPTETDPQRRKLYFRGSFPDVQALVRRFGAVCGRPKKEKGEDGFSYSLFLHKLSPESLAAIEAELRSKAGEKAVEAPAQPQEQSQGLRLTPPPEAVKPAAAIRSAQAKGPEPLCGARLPADPLQNMEDLAVGPFNRFAHAAVTSVVTSPGNIYNPLFICGPPGSGKTHMLHAMAQRISPEPGMPAVLLTSGARLAQAVAEATQVGRLGELEAFAKNSKALLVDDFHMTAVAEQNQAGLAKLFKMYLDGFRQVVLTSIYPARLLSQIEAALEFRIGSGHVVELKLPGAEKAHAIAREAFQRAGLSSDGGDADGFSTRIQDLAALNGALRRLGVAKRFGPGADLRGLIDLVLPQDSGAPAGTPAAAEIQQALQAAAALPDGAVPAALFFPNGQQAYADWVWAQLKRLAKQSQWPFSFRLATRKEYELEPVFGVPFIVAEECRRCGVASALVLSAMPGTALAEQEKDFRYAMEHLLHDRGVGLGWLSYARMKDPASHATAFLDMHPMAHPGHGTGASPGDAEGPGPRYGGSPG
jgi:chromosomal replication initiator protein